MARVRSGDPSRQHLHDYTLTEPFSGDVLVAFSTQVEAMEYAAKRLRGRLTLMQVAHPDGCTCQAGQLVYPDGDRHQAPV